MTYLSMAPTNLIHVGQRRVEIGSQPADVVRVVLSLKNNKRIIDEWASIVQPVLNGQDSATAQLFSQKAQQNGNEAIEVYYTVTLNGNNALVDFYF